MKPIFEIFKDKKSQFRFRLKARNGKVIAQSEGYARLAGCKKGIEAVRACAPEAEVKEV